jgi:hypothetical protein
MPYCWRLHWIGGVRPCKYPQTSLLQTHLKTHPHFSAVPIAAATRWLPWRPSACTSPAACLRGWSVIEERIGAVSGWMVGDA